MTVYEFVKKYEIVQLGNTRDIILNIQALGEMLKNHTLAEVSDIINEMCNVK